MVLTHEIRAVFLILIHSFSLTCHLPPGDKWRAMYGSWLILQVSLGLLDWARLKWLPLGSHPQFWYHHCFVFPSFSYQTFPAWLVPSLLTKIQILFLKHLIGQRMKIHFKLSVTQRRCILGQYTTFCPLAIRHA